MSMETIDLLSLGGAFALAALATVGLAALAAAARVLFASPPPILARESPRRVDEHALAAWEDEGGAQNSRRFELGTADASVDAISPKN